MEQQRRFIERLHAIPIPDGKKLCPFCPKVTIVADREILRHIRENHVGRILDKEERRYLAASNCPRCKKVIADSGKGKHKCNSAHTKARMVQDYCESELEQREEPGAQCRPCTRSMTQAQSSARQDNADTSNAVDPIEDILETVAAASSTPADLAAEHQASNSSAPPTSQTQPESQCTNSSATEKTQVLDRLQVYYAAQTVPKGAREAFAAIAVQVINKLLRNVEASDEDFADAVSEFLQLPAQLLGNKNSSRRRAHAVHNSIKKLRSGTLAAPKPMTTQQRKAADARVAAQVAKQVNRHLENGSISRASRALDAQEVAEPTNQVLEQLKALHPTERPGPPPETTAVPAQVSEQQLRQIIKRLPKGSAPGPSGWTFEHIAVVAQASTEGMTAVLQLVNTVLQGQLPSCENWRASRLIALKKAAGGVRPIAIGEVWARLTSMAAMAACSEIGPGLAPQQLGVGVPGGAECLGHAVRAGAHDKPNEVTVQLDWRNAFNCISRQAVLAAVATRAPTLLPFAQWMYGQPSPLLVAGAQEDIWSSSGVRQGDPCGPLFFAITMQQMLEEVAEVFPEVRVIAYLDDTFLQGPMHEVAAACKLLAERGEALGLKLQPLKCSTFSVGNKPAAKQLAAELGLTDCSDTGIVAAGCPIGSAEFVQAHAETRGETVSQRIEKLMSLERVTSQGKLLVIRKSLQTQLTHLARAVPYEHIQKAMQQVEKKVADSVLTIVGRDSSLVDTEQLELPTRFGGVGLLHLTACDGLVCRAAFLSAAALAQKAMANGSVSFQPFLGCMRDQLEGMWSGVKGKCMCIGECQCSREPYESLDDALPSLPHLQQDVGRRLAEHRAQMLIQKYENMLQDPMSEATARKQLSRLHSVRHQVSTAWLNALPTSEPRKLSDDTVRLGLQFMLGAPTVAPGTSFQCMCNKTVSCSHHAMTCPQLANLRTKRHNLVQQSVRSVICAAGWATSMEPKEGPMKRLLPGDAGYGKRGDILAARLDEILNVDISITHPAADSYCKAAARQTGAAAAERDQRKVQHHAADGTPGYTFIPFSIETYGKLGKPASELLKDMAWGASGDRHSFLSWAYTEISVRLIRQNAEILKTFCGAVARGMGQDFIQGQQSALVD